MLLWYVIYVVCFYIYFFNMKLHGKVHIKNLITNTDIILKSGKKLNSIVSNQTENSRKTFNLPIVRIWYQAQLICRLVLVYRLAAATLPFWLGTDFDQQVIKKSFSNFSGNIFTLLYKPNK